MKAIEQRLTIKRYALRFTPAVSDKDFKKHFQESDGFDGTQLTKRHKLKARIELLCDATDVKKIDELLRELSK